LLVERWVPGVAAARGYRREWLRSDIVSGLVLAAILVPQGMAYAELAGLPAVTGLYTTIACLVGYGADAGSIPVTEGDRLIGMITDRDIALRAVAEGRSPNTPVRDVMTDDIKYCFEDDDVAQVAQNMAELQVRRLPVVNRDKRLVGIVALSNVAQCGNKKATSEMLRGVATPH